MRSHSLTTEALRWRAGTRCQKPGLAVTVRNANGEQVAVILGQADRIELSRGAAAVLDYKSGNLPVDGLLKPAHLVQLACYKLALERIYPDAGVSAAVFDTGSGKAKEATGEDIGAVFRQVLGLL